MADSGCFKSNVTDVRDPRMHLKQKCHPRSGLDLAYVRGEGHMVARCAKCSKLLGLVAVALVPFNVEMPDEER